MAMPITPQMMVFDDWSDMGSAAQNDLPFDSVAPTITYFAPKDIWILAYQWCSAKFCYRTSTDPTDPNSWGGEQSLLREDITNAQYGPIDQEIICDDDTCYLFSAATGRQTSVTGTFSGKIPTRRIRLIHAIWSCSTRAATRARIPPTTRVPIVRVCSP
jgi:hypothetical protein